MTEVSILQAEKMVQVELSRAEQTALKEGEGFRVLGMFQALDFQARHSRVLQALALKKVRDQKLFKRCGVESFARFCELAGIPAASGSELVNAIEDLGPQLMLRAERLDLPREVVRQLRRIDAPTLKEIEKALAEDALTDADARRMVKAAINLAAEERAAARLAGDAVARYREEIEKRKESSRTEHEKRARAEAEVERLQSGDPKDGKYWSLFTRATRSLADLEKHVREQGVQGEDLERFKTDYAQLSVLHQGVWTAFIAAPEGVRTEAQFIKHLQENRGFEHDQAEEIAAETFQS